VRGNRRYASPTRLRDRCPLSRARCSESPPRASRTRGSSSHSGTPSSPMRMTVRRQSSTDPYFPVRRCTSLRWDRLQCAPSASSRG